MTLRSLIEELRGLVEGDTPTPFAWGHSFPGPETGKNLGISMVGGDDQWGERGGGKRRKKTRSKKSVKRGEHSPGTSPYAGKGISDEG